MIQLFKLKSLKKTQETENISLNERTQEKAILKEGIGVNGKLTCTKRAGTRGFSFATYTPSKMGFAVLTSSGRSMVEMLGVLAIIGVLSIGGIQGYTLAMRKYRANEIVNLMNKYATVLYQGCQVKMQNNPIKFSAVERCYSELDDVTLNFTDFGLGSLPTGVVAVASHPKDYPNSWADEDGYGTYLFASLNSHTMVEISILLDDQSLCQNISDMMNEKSRGKDQANGGSGNITYPTPCQKKTKAGKTGYPAHLAFYVS